MHWLLFRWVDLHEQAEKEGQSHGTPEDPSGPPQDSLPGIRLLCDEYTMRRLAKVCSWILFCFYDTCPGFFITGLQTKSAFLVSCIQTVAPDNFGIPLPPPPFPLSLCISTLYTHHDSTLCSKWFVSPAALCRQCQHIFRVKGLGSCHMCCTGNVSTYLRLRVLPYVLCRQCQHIFRV